MDFIIEQASSFASDIDRVIVIVAILGGFWLLLAEAVLFYFMFRFRRSANPKAQYITGEEKHHMKWIHIPHNLVLVCDVIIIIFAIQAWYEVKQSLPDAHATVRIVGQQWAWKFVHPGPDGVLGGDDDVAVVDELHLEVGKTYHFKLESNDVLHSFSVPVFRLKQDSVPGRVITGWFRPTNIGEYDIQCAEMCGIGHGVMAARLYVHSEADYEKWISEQRATRI